MFTLRDQIFPHQAGDAQASLSFYEQSIDDICSATNQAERASAQSAKRLAARMPRARTVLAQRNALLDSATQTLASSEYRLGRFTGLDVPGALVNRARETAAAWRRIVARLRNYTERLDAVTSQHDLLAAVNMLPAMRTALARDGVTRTAGLTELGGGRCRLDSPIVTPTITLPKNRKSATPPALSPPAVTPSVNPPPPAGGGGGGAGGGGGGG
jgi:hypothetical protein